MASEIEEWARSIKKGAGGADISSAIRRDGIVVGAIRRDGIVVGRLEGYKKAIEILGTYTVENEGVHNDYYIEGAIAYLKSKLQEPKT